MAVLASITRGSPSRWTRLGANGWRGAGTRRDAKLGWTLSRSIWTRESFALRLRDWIPRVIPAKHWTANRSGSGAACESAQSLPARTLRRRAGCRAGMTPCSPRATLYPDARRVQAARGRVRAHLRGRPGAYGRRSVLPAGRQRADSVGHQLPTQEPGDSDAHPARVRGRVRHRAV